MSIKHAFLALLAEEPSYGYELKKRYDDAIGLLVVREIRRRLAGHADIDVSESCEMGLALLDHIIGYQRLMIVDAIQTGRVPPGSIHELDGQDLKLLPVASPHFAGVGEMIALGRELGLPVPEQVKIFAIEVADPFAITTEMTPALRNALPSIIERVMQTLPGS